MMVQVKRLDGNLAYVAAAAVREIEPLEADGTFQVTFVGGVRKHFVGNPDEFAAAVDWELKMLQVRYTPAEITVSEMLDA